LVRKREMLMKEALIFIDTNIMLDFYRIRGDIGGLSLLEPIDQNHGRIITTCQVEMEYKKNRQRVILESLARIKTPDWSGLSPPAFLWHAQPAKTLAKSKQEITKQQSKLRRRIAAVLSDPAANDTVYQVLQRLFTDRGPYNLSRDKKVRHQIQRLARKRFLLGCPPRKNNDTAIGDAINWEWIMNCAKESRKNIVIVSRDADYGSQYEDKSILNDWLSQEFKERTSRKRKIVLTDRLTQAFKMIAVPVTKAQEKEEKELLTSDSEALSSRLRTHQELLSDISQAISSQLKPPAEAISAALQDFAQRYPSEMFPGLYKGLVAKPQSEKPGESD
jgi:hypothetical protein